MAHLTTLFTLIGVCLAYMGGEVLYEVFWPGLDHVRVRSWELALYRAGANIGFGWLVFLLLLLANA